MPIYCSSLGSESAKNGQKTRFYNFLNFYYADIVLALGESIDDPKTRLRIQYKHFSYSDGITIFLYILGVRFLANNQKYTKIPLFLIFLKNADCQNVRKNRDPVRI